MIFSFRSIIFDIRLVLREYCFFPVVHPLSSGLLQLGLVLVLPWFQLFNA